MKCVQVFLVIILMMALACSSGASVFSSRIEVYTRSDNGCNRTPSADGRLSVLLLHQHFPCTWQSPSLQGSDPFAVVKVCTSALLHLTRMYAFSGSDQAP